VAEPPVVVAAAVVERHGAYLTTRRLRGTHLEGFWEFPGGKCEPGESHAACLRREMREELGCEALVGEKLLTATHADAERTIVLHFFRCQISREPRPLLGQEIRWTLREDLRVSDFPPADGELIRLLAG
jgi:mutator protein MutT